ncbi:MAG: dTDP-4-dehydrorhamnose 3,5-epimerase [Bacteroidales bacterium]|nr:dTDP-4-dehydrorhamnose 3,5-epimerase [Bacteroidales bacterium]
MEIIRTFISDLIVIKPNVFKDKRGYFFESYNEELFIKNGINYKFVQDNESKSQKNVIRGLHFQNPPYEQAKLIRVIKGKVMDVVVDIRKKSPTYGKYFSIELSEENKTMLLIPAGFAHGFVTMKNETIFSYKCSNFYNKDSEICILWNDADINIKWNINNPVLSEKDKKGLKLKDFISLF